MENTEDNVTKGTPSHNTQSSFTPHELVEHHMQHPDDPITDAEMENLNLGVNESADAGDEIALTPEEKKNADELADAINSDGTGMAYNADV